MKKFKAIVVGLCLVLALGSCGKSEETYTAEELANMSEKELAEIMAQQEKEDKSDKKNKSGKADEPSQEIIDAEWYSGKVQIDGVVYDLPITISELEALGFEYYPVRVNDQYELERINDDYLFGQNEYISVQYFLDDNKIFSSDILNTLEGFHTFADIVDNLDSAITAAGSYSIMPDELTHYYPGGLQVGDSFTLIEERLGTPTEIDSNMSYHYGLSNTNSYFPACKLTIAVDRDTQKIISISTSAQTNPSELSKDSLETISLDNYTCGEDKSVHALSLKMFPGALYEIGDYSGGIFKASFLLDGQVYSFVMYSNLLNYSPDNYTTYLLSETDEEGVTRTLDEFFEYTVFKNGYQMQGRIEVRNLSTSGAEYAYSNDTFKDALFEIIRSIQLD